VVWKKSLQKKAPLERFFSETFLRFRDLDIVATLKSQKTFGKKIVLREPFFGDFFWRLFLETFFGDFFWRLFLQKTPILVSTFCSFLHKISRIIFQFFCSFFCHFFKFKKIKRKVRKRPLRERRVKRNQRKGERKRL